MNYIGGQKLRKRLRKQLAEKAYFILIAALAVLCLVLYYMSADEEKDDEVDANNGVESLVSDWYLGSLASKESERVLLPNRFDVEAGETLSISRRLQDINDGEALGFRTAYTSVRVCIEGEEIYSFGWDEEMTLGDSPGSVWNVVELEEEYNGKILTIDYLCAYDKYSGMVNDIFIGKTGEIYTLIINESLPTLFGSGVSLIIGLLMMLVYFIGLRKLKIKQLLFISVYLILNGMWGFVESGFMQFITGEAYFFQTLGFIINALIPLGAVMALHSLELVQKHFKIVFGTVFSSVLLVIGLQLFDIFDFVHTVGIVHISILLSCGIIFSNNYREYSEKKNRDFMLIFAAFLVLFISAIIDMFRYYVFASTEHGTFFRYGSVVFTLILGIWAMEQALSAHKKTVERETYVSMAYTDNLTGILNRRAFDEDLRNIEMDRVEAVIVMMDLNNLKKINDNYGHQAGDDAIKSIANNIKIFRDKYGELCYRTGGDEFCVICKKMTINDIIAVCEDINEQLNSSNVVDGVKLSMAYGYKIYDPGKRDTIEQVVSQADKQMYEKKEKMKKDMLG